MAFGQVARCAGPIATVMFAIRFGGDRRQQALQRVTLGLKLVSFAAELRRFAMGVAQAFLQRPGALCATHQFLVGLLQGGNLLSLINGNSAGFKGVQPLLQACDIRTEAGKVVAFVGKAA